MLHERVVSNGTLHLSEPLPDELHVLIQKRQAIEDTLDDLKMVTNLLSPSYVLDQFGRERMHQWQIRLVERLTTLLEHVYH